MSVIAMSYEDRRAYFLMKMADDMAAASNYDTAQGYREFLTARKNLEDTITNFTKYSNKNEHFINSIMQIVEKRKVTSLNNYTGAERRIVSLDLYIGNERRAAN